MSDNPFAIVTMNSAERRSVAATLRRCKGKACRPTGVSRADEDAAMARGFLRFHDLPIFHYEITEAGREFLKTGRE